MSVKEDYGQSSMIATTQNRGQRPFNRCLKGNRDDWNRPSIIHFNCSDNE